MKNSKLFFESLAAAKEGGAVDAAQAAEALRFEDGGGLLPVVAQCAESGRVLMLAWMNREALAATLKSGRMVYYSRSRGKLWTKGETSGHFQQWRELRVDCDGDALLALVQQTGAACHTFRPSCFFVSLAPKGAVISTAADTKEKK